jgi:hypothetical protein
MRHPSMPGAFDIDHYPRTGPGALLNHSQRPEPRRDEREKSSKSGLTPDEWRLPG